MIRGLLMLCITVLASSGYAVGYPSTFEAAARLADQVVGTRAGIEYTNKFADAEDKWIAHAMQACVRGRKTEIRYRVIFIIAADGRIVRIFHTPGHPVADCFAKNLRMPPLVPKPPRDGWPVDWVVVHAP
jgi:hypothetical protein